MKKFFYLMIFSFLLFFNNINNFVFSASSDLEELSLEIDYNNPFCPKNNEVTKIKYVVKNTNLRVKVFISSISGKFVKLLVENVALKDTVYIVNWDGKDQNGEILPSGLYIITLLTEDNRSVSKLVAIIDKR